MLAVLVQEDATKILGLANLTENLEAYSTYRPSKFERFGDFSMTQPQNVHDAGASVCESDLALPDDIVNVTTMDPMADTAHTDLGDPDTARTDLSDTTFVPQMDISEVEIILVVVADDFNVDQMVAVAPADIGEEVPKKRGRKRKSQDEARPSRGRRPKKPKVYEIETPFENEEMERKRKNAQNAKRHRDLQKQRLLDMQMELSSATAGSDSLQEVQKPRQEQTMLMQQIEVCLQDEVQQLRQEQTMLMQQIEVYQQQNEQEFYSEFF